MRTTQVAVHNHHRPEGGGAAPNHQEGLEPRQDIPLGGSQTVAPEVVREISPARATPGSRPADLARQPFGEPLLHVVAHAAVAEAVAALAERVQPAAPVLRPLAQRARARRDLGVVLRLQRARLADRPGPGAGVTSDGFWGLPRLWALRCDPPFRRSRRPGPPRAPPGPPDPRAPIPATWARCLTVTQRLPVTRCFPVN